MKTALLALGFVAALGTTAGNAAGFLTNNLPLAGGKQYPSTLPLTGVEQIPADTQLTQGQNPASEAITVNQLGAALTPTRTNYLIGGVADTNLWQRNTTGSSQTTTYAYGGPDRWAYWSGTNTAVTLSRVTTAAALPTGNAYAFRFQRTAAQAGVVQACMAQEIESVNSTSLAGQTVELDFNAYTGANYSPTNSNVTAYVIYGTSTDEGMQKLAYGLNAGGGGSTGWTGQANATAAVISLGAVSTAGRYAAVATVPATATEVGVALCFTPTGTAGTTDAVYFDNIQLVKNPNLASFASATAGYSCANASTTAQLPQCTPIIYRDITTETALQQRYYYQVNEPAAGVFVAPCGEITTAYMVCTLDLPTPMRAAPTLAFSTQSVSTWEMFSASATPITLSGATSLIQNAFGANTTTAVGLKFTGASTPFTAGYAGTLAGAGGGANIQASAEL